MNKISFNNFKWVIIELVKGTVETQSRATIVMISAQDTTPGHAFSNRALIVSMTSNPLAELRLIMADFSLLEVGVSSSKIDASHPYLYNKEME